jgi:hypothetical protein
MQELMEKERLAQLTSAEKRSKWVVLWWNWNWCSATLVVTYKLEVRGSCSVGRSKHHYNS